MNAPAPVGFGIEYGNYVQSDEFCKEYDKWLLLEDKINDVKLRTCKGTWS